EGALVALDRALSLCVGTPLGTITGPFADVERARLAELRLDVVEERAEVLLSLGRLAELTTELGPALAANPLREATRALLIRVLHGQGEHDKAGKLYRDGAELMAEKLGVEPGPVLRELRDTLLTTEPEPARAVPSQLPHDTRRFTGRDTELGRLDAL